MEQQHVCTMFCGCGSSTQANSFDATTFTTDIPDDSSTDSDDYTIDHDID